MCKEYETRREVGRDEDLKAEVGTRNAEFLSLQMANGLNRLNRQRAAGRRQRSAA